MPIQADLVASGLAAPTFAASAPGVADQLFITEKDSGRVVVLDLTTNQVSAQAFFDVPAAEMSFAGEGGLLGLAFHPDYATNGKVYLNLTNEAGDSELWEITRSASDPSIADPASARVLMTVDRTATNHVGGWIGFGPDGFLYIASGDSGGSGDPENAAQNVNDLRGKMLRIDVNSDAFPADAGRDYAIPAGNPFVGVEGADEVFAYGLRNPWRASFDRATGDLYIADVGQAAREEIDFLAAGTGAGTNFGWRVLEGTLPTGYPQLDNPPANDPSLTAPIHEYGHDEGRTIIGGYVYRGPGGAQGEYFFADFITDRLWTARVVDGEVVAITRHDDQLIVNGGTLDMIVSFAEDGQGRLYVIGLDGEVFRLTPTAAGPMVYQFSALSDGQAISFDPGADVLNFDQSAISAADIRATLAGSNVVITHLASGKDVTLLNVSPLQLATSNVSFANGSRLLFGDNSPGTAGDNAANTHFGAGGNDLLSGFGGADALHGGAGNDVVLGGADKDTLRGNDGTDWLEGGAGSDNLGGGGGQDSFVFREAGSANADVLSDYASNWDNIQLDAAFFTSLGASGRFASGDARFVANSTGTAQDAGDRIVLNTATGQLFYDADGSGSGAAQHFATLPSGRTVIASDFWVFGTAPSSGQTINGTSGNDSLVGGPGDDTINGFEGNDTLDGGDGDDSLLGGFGSDLLEGGTGNDTLRQGGVDLGDGDTDTLDGGLGNDTYIVHEDPFQDNAEIVFIDAGGIDTVITNQSFTLPSGLENLILQEAVVGTGNALDNVIVTRSNEPGQYFVDGADGNDTLIGGSDSDSFSGDSGDDSISGGESNDSLVGGAGSDAFVFDVAPGEENADEIGDFASGSDKLVLDGTVHANSGPSGNFSAGDARFWSSGTGTAHDADDRVIYNTSNGQLWYDADGNGAGPSQLIATLQGAPEVAATDISVINGSGSGGGGQVINGTSGNDTLSGGPGNDTINGLGGNDLFLAGGSGGADVIDGGAGFDSIEFKERAASGVVVDYSAGTITGGGPGTISFTGIERVVAGNFNDSMTGSAAGQILTGQGGADTLWGAGGIDTLWGGAGADTFIFRETGSTNADTVRDWTSGSDKVALDDAAMSALGASGNFSTGDARFAAGAGFTSGRDASDRVVYNTSTGSLYYDADGSGAGAAELIATFSGVPAVAATDIVVI